MSISVNYASLQEVESQIKAISGRLNDQLDQLKSKLAQIEWEGSDAEQYHQYQDQWSKAQIDLNQVLAQIGAAVGVAHQNYSDTEATNRGMWNGG